MSWGDLKVEEIDENNYEDEKNLHVTTGLVEECLDSENVSEHSHNRLHISRGVSIVSLSEDERTLSRNNSAVDASEKNDEIENEKELTAEEESPQKHEAKESDYWTSPKGAEIADTFEDVKEKKDEMFEAPPNESGPVGEPDFGQKNSLNDFPQQNDNDDAFFKPQAKYDSPGLETLRKSETANELDSESDVEEDPAVKALLKRIKKQRSVLEEILTKEADTQKEGT